ncbi:MAG: alpha-amylase [Parafilimonas sp.]|nr:alpha-amylase [Parafilimonas sp.]
MMQFFEWYYAADGSLWNNFKNEIDKLKNLGITAVWLPPAYKGMKGEKSEGYDVYDIYDLGEFDQRGTIRTKYGTKAEYIKAIDAAHEKGLHIYADIVLNHMGGADETERVQVKKANPENRNEYISDVMEIEAATKFTFPGRNKKYSSFVWDHKCFTGVDYANNLQEEGVFEILNGYEGWEEVINNEKGNYDFLMLADIEFRNEHVKEELKRWIKWYYETTHFDGLRLDAVKHIPAYFYNEWVDYIRTEINKDLFIVGEYWSSNILLLQQYIEATSYKMSLMDAPLQARLHKASECGNEFNFSEIFNDTLVAQIPQLAVTFVDNHDTQPCQSLEAPVAAWFKPLAYALILLREQGYPCIFYADLYGTEYTDKSNDGTECHIVLNKVPELEKLLLLRKDYAYGLQRDYFDHANCIGWTREGIDEKEFSGCAVVISNGNEGIKTMKIGKKHAGKTFTDYLQKNNKEIIIDENGFGTFYCAPGSVSVWVESRI